jgi:hypothetical protein
LFFESEDFPPFLPSPSLLVREGFGLHSSFLSLSLSPSSTLNPYSLVIMSFLSLLSLVE